MEELREKWAELESPAEVEPEGLVVCCMCQGAGCGMEGHPQIPLEPWVSGSDLDVESLACCQARGGDGAVPVVSSVKIR